MRIFRCLIGVVLLSLALPALAHHSNTPYDMTKMLQATGEVVKADFKNPHSSMTLSVDTDKGKQNVTWEGHSLATLRHYGLKPAMVKLGDRITISYAPRRDGLPGGIFLKVTIASGETLDFSHLGYETPEGEAKQ